MPGRWRWKNLTTTSSKPVLCHVLSEIACFQQLVGEGAALPNSSRSWKNSEK
jgi:hypothetical protein